MIKIFEMFSGYGGASFGLKKANIDFECVGFSEIDKYATQCYEQNHNKTKNFGDCTKINPNDIEDFDLLTGGFPCQAFSQAGKMQGELDIRGTLFNEIIRIAELKQPKYMLLENVKGLTTKRFKDTFNKILSELNKIGYNVYWEVLNSKEQGIPQNRERVWFVCFRKDIDNYDKFMNPFKFPKKQELTLFLKDILEKEVDEKYYLSEEQTQKLIYRTQIKTDEISEPSAFDVYNKKVKKDGVSPALTEPHHNSLRLLEVKNATSKGYSEAEIGDGINLEQPNSETRRGRVQKQISPTLQCNDLRATIDSQMRIRKLTPTECFRLMGFLGDEINLDNLSDTQKYKLAGNGWDINVVSKIIKEMLKNEQ